MIYLINIAITVLLSFLTLSFSPYFDFFNISPLFVIYFLVACAYFRKGFEPFALAAFTGILYDMFSANPFGFNLAIFLLTVAAVRYFFQEEMKSLSFWYYAIFTLSSIAIYNIAQYVILYLNGERFQIINFWPLMLSVLIHAIFAIIFYVLLVRLFEYEKHLENKLKRR